MQIRVPRSLHAKYKAACSLLGVKMTEDLVKHMEAVVKATLPTGASTKADGAERQGKSKR